MSCLGHLLPTASPAIRISLPVILDLIRDPEGEVKGMGPKAAGKHLAALRRFFQGQDGFTMIGRMAALIRYIVGMALTATLMAASSAMAADEAARLFASHALGLRQGAVAGEHAARALLAQMPGMSRQGAYEFWPPVFENAIVKLGRLRSPAPVALYYNPLLDIAVFTLWRKQGKAYRVASIRAVPGERLADAAVAVALQPTWTRDKAAPIAALRAISAERLGFFREAHPASAVEGGRESVTFAAAAKDLRAVLPRLAWNMAMRMQWAADGSVWLGPTLGEIDDALGTRDAGAIRTAASGTDLATAAALARLPVGFTEGLRLDMALDAGGNAHLLVASLPVDGHLYLFALCRLSGSNCGLRRLFLMSLAE